MSKLQLTIASLIAYPFVFLILLVLTPITGAKLVLVARAKTLRQSKGRAKRRRDRENEAISSLLSLLSKTKTPRKEWIEEQVEKKTMEEILEKMLECETCKSRKECPILEAMLDRQFREATPKGERVGEEVKMSKEAMERVNKQEGATGSL